jgi:hypothetical protein
LRNTVETRPRIGQPICCVSARRRDFDPEQFRGPNG